MIAILQLLLVMGFGLGIAAIVAAVSAFRSTRRLVERVEVLGVEIRDLKRRVRDLESADGLSAQTPRAARSSTDQPEALAGAEWTAKGFTTDHETGVLDGSLASAPQPKPAPAFSVGVGAMEPPRLGEDRDAAGSSALGATPSAPLKKGSGSGADQTVGRGGVDWERFMGARLFAWLGGLALFLGVAYFVKYSFDRNLIPPSGRVAIGLTLGIGLLAGGLRLRARELVVTAQTLCATAVVILYAALFTGHAVYRLAWLPQSATFLAMSLVTAVAFFLAIRMSAQVVAVLGLLGGFLTPILVSSGTDQPAALFSYVALLDLGLLAIALHRRWDHLAVMGAVGTVLIIVGWLGRFFTPDRVALVWWILALFNALFVGGLVAFRWRRTPSDKVSVAAAVVGFLNLCFASWLLLDARWGDQPGWIFGFVVVGDLTLLAAALWGVRAGMLHGVAGLVAFGLLSYWQVRYLTPERLAWALGLSVGFTVLHTVVPLSLGRLREETRRSRLLEAMPAVGLFVLIIPIVRLPDVSLSLWPAILLIDLLALGLAAWIGLAVGAIAALVINGVALALWIQGLPMGRTGGLGGTLLVMTLMSFAFTVGGAALFHRRSAADGRVGGQSSGELGRHQAVPGPGVEGFLPILAVLMPFLLLAQIAVALRPPEPSPVFAVALLILGVLLALTLHFRIEFLPLLGLAGLALVMEVWAMGALGLATRPAIVALWSLVFHAVFMLFPFVFQDRLQGMRSPWIAAALSGLLSFHIVYQLADAFWSNPVMGLIPLALATVPLAAIARLARTRGRDGTADDAWTDRLAWMGGVALFLVTVALPIQFDRKSLTVGFALEGAALLWLHRRVVHPGLIRVGLGLLGASFVRLTLNPGAFTDAVRNDLPILNGWLFAYGLTAVALFLGARWVPREHAVAPGVRSRAVLVVLGVILLFLLVNLEIADVFTPVGEAVQLYVGRHFARDMTYTIAWAVFALGLVGSGIRLRLAGARWSGLGLLGVAVTKLFLYDLARLDQLYRVGALVGVAIVTITASILYQRFVAREDAAALGDGDRGSTPTKPGGSAQM